MKRLGFLLLPSLVVLALIGIIFGGNPADAVVSNADYSGTPPFISTVVTPNVLIMLDNSGSMGYRAYCDGTTNDFFTISSITRGTSGTAAGKVATVTYAKGHGWTALTLPATVTVTGVTTSTASNANYNAVSVVPTFISSTKISYNMVAQPATTPAPGNPLRTGSTPPRRLSGVRSTMSEPHDRTRIPTNGSSSSTSVGTSTG